ncbi:MAG: 50S ribosomal protein L9 [bacterium]|nr:50S ribosomal protein L9 [bacterium]
MKVIILKDNKVKDVNDGYAINYLLPKGLAKIATPTELNKRDSDLLKKEVDRKSQDKIDNDKATEYENKEFSIKLEKIGESGRLYGAITGKDIANAAKVDKENVLLKEPIKISGRHTIELKFGQYHSNISLIIEKEKSE